MELVFLSARNTPLTKSFERTDGKLIKHSYPRVHRFTSSRETVTSIERFGKALEKHAKSFDCLLKGTLQEDLHNESRAGKTGRDDPTSWVCLDIDGLPGVSDPAELLKEIPECDGVSHVIQYSSSMGVVPEKGLSAHVFMLLHAPLEPAQLKLWLYHLNLTIPMLRENIRLNRLGTTLTWPLDISTCQNDKLLYIAPPILKDGMTDPFKGKRIVVRKGRRSRTLKPDYSLLSSREIEQERQTLLATLRKEAGLPARKFTTKTLKGFEVSSKPDSVEITELKEDRGFTYMNLNGGDSWAYYHPTTSPDVLFNFKGEPNLALRDISPAYYKEAVARARELRGELREKEVTDKVAKGQGLIYLAFRAALADQYYIGVFDAATQEAAVNPTSNLTKLQHFLVENDQPLPEAVPTWHYEFRFDRLEVFNPEQRFLNRYVPTAFIGLKAEPRCPDIPPVIGKLLRSMLNDDGPILEHFLNWLAYAYQSRKKPGTAWILHGTEGTGKNLFFGRVIRKIFGERQSIILPLDSLDDQFNQHLEEAVFALFNEADIEETRSKKKVGSRLRELITDDTISIRPMRGARYETRSYVNVVLASNRPVSIEINAGDRRYNVARWQPQKLSLTDAEVDGILDEVPQFARYLATRKASRSQARDILETADRARLQEISGNSTEDVAKACLSGDLDFFHAALPDAAFVEEVDPYAKIRHEAYRKTLLEAVQSLVAGEEHRVSRDQLHLLFSYCLDRVPGSPHKFTKFLKYNGLFPTRLRKGEALVQAVSIHWRASADVLEDLRQHLSPEARRTKLKRVK